MRIKALAKKIIPKRLFPLYHLALAKFAAFIYGHPSRKMVIIGVTGTRGKTTTSNYLWSVLTAAGYKVGQTGTANIRIGEYERLNPYHMTMPGRLRLQKLLAEMRHAGCEIAVVETPSEGIEQFRHKDIAYDFLVFTVLYPEKLAIHGWDPERCTKKMIEPFAELMSQPRKELRGAHVPKAIIVNRDSDGADRFLSNVADRKTTFGLGAEADIRATDIADAPDGVDFSAADRAYRLNIPGEYNVMNALPSLAVGRILEIPEETVALGLARLGAIPGRMEKISAGQDFSVFVDYAHDGPSMHALLSSAQKMKKLGAKLIVVVGAEGGGRDRDKRPVMGRFCAQLADITIVTDVDPYDDDPAPIRSDIAMAARLEGAKDGENLFDIADRRAGIAKALSLAGENDIVVITGKGAEQSMEIGGKSIPWDDRVVVREELGKLV